MRLVVAFSLYSLILSTPSFANNLVLTSPPRESAEKAREIFEPIASFMSRALNQTVTYRYPGNWLTYQSEMQKDMYDIVFDGPHFVSYRMTKYQHTPMVKLPGQFIFVIIAMKDNARINRIEDINGRRLCAPAPPNLGALTALAQFPNPARQPLLVNTKGFPQAYEGLLGGKCTAASMQIKIFEKLNNDKQAAKVLFESKGLPNQAFSASPRIDAAQLAKLTEALLSASGKQATNRLRVEYNGQDFVAASSDEYKGHALLLKDVWGFGI